MTDRTGHPSQPGGEHPGCQQAREEAAIALLSKRDPAPDTKAHLERCPPCHHEWRELAALPALLNVARQTIAHPPTPPNPLLLDRLLTEMGRRRRRRRVITAMVAAAAVVVIALPAARLLNPGTDGDERAGAAPPTRVTATSGTGFSSATTPDGAGSSGGTAPSEEDEGSVASATGAAYATGSGTDRASGTSVRVALHVVTGGSELRVSVRGMPPGSRCRLLVQDAAGHAVPAGDWTVDSRYRGPYIEQIPLAPSTVRRVDVLDDRTGRRLVSVALLRA